MPGPLAGIRVLDVCQLAVGPWAATLLGQLGAEVIKIEEPKGDPIRALLPWMNGVGTYYTAVNLNKQNIALNLKDPADLDIALRLAERADVFVENFRPGVMERLGLGYEALHKLNPGIIYCSSSGYGSRGPRRAEGSADGYARSFTGFDSINGRPGQRPERFRNRGHIDHASSAVVAQTILAALYARERYGIGQRVETSMMQAAMIYQTSRVAEYFATGAGPRPMGSATTNLVPHQAFSTLDDYIAIGVNTQDQWRILCQGLGMPDLAADPRFRDNPARVANREALIDILGQAFAGRTTEAWLAILEPLAVPCGPFLTFQDLCASPHIAANEMVVEVEHPWGRVKVGGAPWRFSASPAAVRPAPALDQHRAEILQLIRKVPARTADGRTPATEPRAPLEGLLVVELAQGLAAPFAAMQLGDLGAEVIKVEPPEGDWARSLGPPFMGDEGPVFLALNRNKKGMVLDLTDDADAATFKELIARADILVTDLLPAEAQRLGLDYQDVSALNPRVVHCSVTPFGERGPLQNKPGGEIVLQAMGDIWRYLGVLGQHPLRLGADVAALAAGIFGVQGVLAALVDRARHDIGQKVEVSHLGALLALESHLNAAQSDPSLAGGWHLSAPTEPPEYSPQARDLAVDFGFLARAEGGWESFCRALGIPEEYCRDPRFATGLGRTLNRAAFLAMFEPFIRDKTAAELKRLIEEHGGIAVTCNVYESLFQDPQVAAMGMLVDMPHPTLGNVRTLGLPWNLEKTPGAIRMPAPTLGQHTHEIKARLCGSLSFSTAAVSAARLEARRAVSGA